MITVVDVENTVTKHERGIDLSPYNPGNRLVSVGLGHVVGDDVQLLPYVFIDHAEYKCTPQDIAYIQSILDKTTLLVGHNLKHDLAWLLEAGFTYSGACYDTMIGEYVFSRGLKDDLSLEGSCIRRGVTLKKSDIFHKYFDKGVSVAEIPIDELREYGEGDIISTADLFISQQKLYANPYNVGLVPTRDMMNEFLYVLTDMERNGIKIDLVTLDAVEAEYKKELADLLVRLEDIKHKVMGDTPINLASPEQLSCLIYSRRVKDKKAWAETFSIGLNARGKPLPRPDMSPVRFAANVREQTNILRKTRAKQCPECKGKGHYFKTRINGEFYKRPTSCPACGGSGVVYDDLTEYAGLRQSPRNIWDCTSNGFATDKETLTHLAEVAAAKGNKDAADFLSAMVRVNAIETYLSSFVGGIRRNTRPDGILHPRFNQCITATGRLSSSDP
jgi:DNA polymerase I-like protein with 3'-5' exonuclease and polymerase domains